MHDVNADQAGPGDMRIRRKAQKFRFAYDIRYERGGNEICRRTVDDEVVQLRFVDERTMPPAFVVEDRPRGGDRMELTIRRFEAALWWPILTATGIFEESDFRRGLAAGDERSLALFDRAMAASAADLRRDARIPAKAVIRSSRDERIAVAHRAAADLAICGGSLYIRGGEPMYFCPGASDEDGPFAVDPIQLTDPTRRRIVYKSRGPIPLGYGRPSLLRDCARKGRIFRADELETASALVLAEGLGGEPRLTVRPVDNEPLLCDPVAIHLAESLRFLVDCHFSKLGRDPARNACSCFEAIHEIGHLAVSGEQNARRMFASLERFRDCCAARGEELSPELRSVSDAAMTEIESVLDHCRRRGVAAPARLRPEEEAVLYDLANLQQ